MAEETTTTTTTTTTSPIRFGIVGCAEIARKVSRAIALAPNATLVAVGSRSLDKARRFIAENALSSSVRAVGSYEELLDDPAVDAVYMPLPTSLHARWAVAAAERGSTCSSRSRRALRAELDPSSRVRRHGVQFMDSTMWIHNPRTAHMRGLLSDPSALGTLRWFYVVMLLILKLAFKKDWMCLRFWHDLKPYIININSIFSFYADEDFLKNDIRVKPDLDALGALGDAGWYCIRSSLWAADYQLPKTATAFRNPVLNDAGVILSCGATLLWEDGKIAIFHCSFLSHLTMDLTVIGTRGSLHVNDFIIPYEEKSAEFSFASDSGFTELVTGWQPLPSKHVVTTELPQEALMVQEFSRLVAGIRDSGNKPEEKWPTITRKTQLVIDAVKASIDKGFEPVEIVG
ncbi:putative oxidoreductase [Ananas comosus]|uniref:Putative oxidoreductase n=1 Tax=Ananas comosus TaxID=4615 RepID=A0A199VV95_ANACO|nr:putative oxidoreductase [Ananas comosus]